MSYTQPIFEPGVRYQATHSFKSGPTSAFVEGEILLFEKDMYSPYDSSFVYLFRSVMSGEEKTWWLPEGEDKGNWKRDFTEVSH